MTLKNYNAVATGLLLAGLLSACAPNPYVLQDRVYGGRPAVPPSYNVEKPVVKVAPAAEAVQHKKPSQAQQQDSSAATVSVVDKPQDAVTAQAVMPAKQYKSSAAVQALMKQADADVAKGNLDNAADTLERALRIEADNPDVWMKLSQINAQQGHQEQAASMANKAKSYQEQLN